ncbi:hypothetical protein MBORA_07190 [Methanobrevibacter oralis]|uniref:Uncharacterized protein n=1 Tax=Methanobrevibacter oralis TaxID=66851 RepID=A0A166BH61_METOA|nr:UPF0104 family protein [Methanobrevibacter oralis]KZX13348.1 hypothetical protein MBORA_07190 [Methanobrevibacter oralis]
MDKKSILFLLLSIIILLVMLYFVGIENVIDALKVANLTYIIIAFGIQIFTFYLYTLRWQILNKLANINTGILKLLPMLMVGLAVNNITPSGRGGGEPVRAYILSKHGGYLMEETFATVVADRALDTFPFVILAIIAILGMAFYFDFDLWLLVVMVISVIVIVAALIVIIYMSINPKFGKRVDGWIIGLVRRFYKKNSDELENKIHKVIAGFQDTMKLVIYNKSVLYHALPLSFLIWIFEIVRVYFVFLAFGANLNPIIIAEVFILASLVGMIPLLPGGLGAVDGVMILFYSAAGITASVSAAATVIERLISFWLATIIGMIILPHYGSSVLDKKSLSSSSDEISEVVEDDVK